MSDMDDIDRRFQELTAQIDEEERRKRSRAVEREWAHLPRFRRRRRRRIIAASAAAATAVLVAAAGVLVTYRPELLDSVGTVLAERLPVFGESPVPAPEEAAAPGAEPMVPSPFDGSPAADYADGTEGLVMPPARAVGGLGKKDVARLLDRTRALLEASNLDHRTLLEGDPVPFARLLPARNRAWFLQNVDGKKKRRGEHVDTRYWLTSFAPGSASLATDVIKVHGTAKLSSFREDGVSGALVKVDYLFVYAVHRPGLPYTTRRVIARRMGEVGMYRESGEPVIWIRDWRSGGVTGVRCDVDDAFVHPSYEDSPEDEEATRATGAPVDPYDLADRSDGDCWLASRT
ncbi:hypothetical protein GCM10014719_02710 [Planomonospora parontospora subsp. antibiotica]|nr:hypothetical protein GCM10014719_02710 [Planomonospora parontospora subsp. antibiotica]GII13430.1 hypothetical protein Ppa05_01560 [Planomonospora parontospora subsp. antibiotica]